MAPLNLSLGQMAAMASMLEVAAPKPGNVHRGADFADVTLQDFLASGIAIVPVFDQAEHLSLGHIVLDAVRATRQVICTNTNLGIILLLAPLAKAQSVDRLQAAAAEVVRQSNMDDARLIYEAIRSAQPGGMGTSTEHDVLGNAPAHILDAMQLAAGRDSVARQYVGGFADLFETVVPALADLRYAHYPLSRRIVRAHVAVMAALPDTLIRRKAGDDIARQSSLMASRVLEAGDLDSEEYTQGLAHLDFWLRSHGNQRNPGTTADLITAGLFVLLRRGDLAASLA